MIKLNDKIVKFDKFPNGEIKLSLDDIVEIDNYPRNISLKFESNEDLTNLIILKNCLKNKCSLNVGYFPYSRMDRKNNDYAFTLKIIAKIINELDFYSVVIGEPHSDVVSALVDNSTSVYYTKSIFDKLMLNKECDKDTIVMFPDVGAQKRYSSMFSSQTCITANKERDFKTGNIKFLKILEDIDIAGKDVIIVDDLCSKGGTFIMAAKALKEKGVKNVSLLVGHCEDNIFNGEILTTDLISKVYTTDTILTKTHNKINVTKVF